MRVAKINTTTRKFFHHWLLFTLPFHNLNGTQQKLVAEFLYYRHMLSIEVSSKELIDPLLFHATTKRKIAKAAGIKYTSLSPIMTILRNKGIIIGKSISPMYIPDINIEDGTFTLAYKFSISEEAGKAKNSNKTT
jgi:hypothetical protein